MNENMNLTEMVEMAAEMLGMPVEKGFEFIGELARIWDAIRVRTNIEKPSDVDLPDIPAWCELSDNSRTLWLATVGLKIGGLAKSQMMVHALNCKGAL